MLQNKNPFASAMMGMQPQMRPRPQPVIGQPMGNPYAGIGGASPTVGKIPARKPGGPMFMVDDGMGPLASALGKTSAPLAGGQPAASFMDMVGGGQEGFNELLNWNMYPEMRGGMAMPPYYAKNFAQYSFDNGDPLLGAFQGGLK